MSSSWLAGWTDWMWGVQQPRTEAAKAFTKEELQELRQHIAQAGGGRGTHLDMGAFASGLCQFSSTQASSQLAHALFQLVGHGKMAVVEADIIEAKARSEYLGEDVARDFSFSLLRYLASGKHSSNSTSGGSSSNAAKMAGSTAPKGSTMARSPQESHRGQPYRAGIHVGQPHTLAPSRLGPQAQTHTQPAASPAQHAAAPAAPLAQEQPASHPMQAAQAAHTSGAITEPGLAQAISYILAFVLELPPAAISGSVVAAAAEGALRHAAGPGNTTSAYELTREGYERWIKSLPAVHVILASLLMRAGAPKTPSLPPVMTPTTSRKDLATLAASQAAANAALKVPGVLRMPQLLEVGALSVSDLLLHPAASVLMASCLSPDMREEWRLLFHSQRDGKSFNTCFGRVSQAGGPTLMLVKDKGGHIMGGFASKEWKKNGAYYGDAGSFVFSLAPALQVFNATGVNANFQWCGVGFSELPNGLGFGGAQGAAGQFAVYVDSTLDSGMSRPIATYGSPSLSTTQVFEVAVVEVWGVQKPEDDPSVSSGSHGKGKSGKGSASVLDRQQDRAFAEIAGIKVSHSAGLREPPPESEL